MNEHSNIEERLWSYIDGAGSAAERSFIEQLIATDAEWKAKYGELLSVQDMLSNQLELEEPSMRFTQNIMESIGKYQIAPAAKTYINKRIIWGIGAFFICSMIGFLIAGFAQVDWSAASAGTASNIPSFKPLQADIDKVNVGRFFNNTYAYIFMMINVVLGLIVLDMRLGKKKAEVGNRK